MARPGPGVHCWRYQGQTRGRDTKGEGARGRYQGQTLEGAPGADTRVGSGRGGYQGWTYQRGDTRGGHQGRTLGVGTRGRDQRQTPGGYQGRTPGWRLARAQRALVIGEGVVECQAQEPGDEGLVLLHTARGEEGRGRI